MDKAFDCLKLSALKVRWQFGVDLMYSTNQTEPVALIGLLDSGYQNCDCSSKVNSSLDKNRFSVTNKWKICCLLGSGGLPFPTSNRFDFAGVLTIYHCL